jgi:hypothetical protein
METTTFALRSRRWATIAGRCILLIFVGSFSYRCVGFSREVYRIATLPRIPPDAAALAVLDKLLIENFSWRRDSGLLLLRFKIKNISEDGVTGLELTCDATDSAGAYVDQSVAPLYVTLKPGEEKAFWDLPLGYMRSGAAKVVCVITNLQFVSVTSDGSDTKTITFHPKR